MTVRLFLLSAIAALPACSVMRAPSRMDEAGLATPGSWESTRQAQAGVDTDWVRQFGDSTLTSLVKTALDANPDLKIAAAKVDQARADIRAAGAKLQPMVDGGLTGTRTKRNFIGFPIGGQTQGQPGAAEQVSSSLSNTFGLSLDVQWELDVWGRIRAGASAAAAAAEAVEADYRAARASLGAQVARGYFTVVEANRQAQLAEEALKVYEDTAKAIEDRFRSGQADEGSLGAQLRLARSDVASARAALDQRKGAQADAVRAVQTLLGTYPSKIAAWSGRKDLPGLTKTPPAGLPSELLQRRPDIIAAERRFAARGMSMKEARLAPFPRLSLTGSTGTSAEALKNVLNSDFGVWSLGGSVVQNILTGGQVQAEITRRTSQEQEALAGLQKTVLNAFSEVEQALDNESTLRSREAALREAERLAAEADSEARANYRNGLGDILTVLQTQSRLVQARSQLASVQRLRLDNRVALHLALGGGFS